MHANIRTPENRAEQTTPIYAPIDRWCSITGMGRSSTYNAIGDGHLKTVKVGRRTLIDVPHGLAWLRSLPAAQVAAPAPRRGSAA